MSFFDEVYKVCKEVPEGKVITYGDIALMIGRPRCSRQVGWALHSNPEPEVIPCHRVVNRHGKLSGAFAFGGEGVQKELLEAEGVEVSEDGIVNLDRYLWRKI
jgi:O-6-methylguanine DNA methyltransferase